MLLKTGTKLGALGLAVGALEAIQAGLRGDLARANASAKWFVLGAAAFYTGGVAGALVGAASVIYGFGGLAGGTPASPGGRESD